MNPTVSSPADRDDRNFLEQQQHEAEEQLEVRSLTKDNAVFARTEGGFVALTYTTESGEVKTYPRVAVHRCFPFSDPAHFISIREPDGNGREIGLIEDLGELPPEMQDMLTEQLRLRYFAPKIIKINRIHDEYGYSYWDALTDKGACRFTVRSGGGSVYPIGKNRYLINDIDGNRFEIPDLQRLSAKEIRMVDLYI